MSEPDVKLASSGRSPFKKQSFIFDQESSAEASSIFNKNKLLLQSKEKDSLQKQIYRQKLMKKGYAMNINSMTRVNNMETFQESATRFGAISEINQ